MSKITFTAVIIECLSFLHFILHVVLYQSGFSRKTETVDSIIINPLSLICPYVKKFIIKNWVTWFWGSAGLKCIGQSTRLATPAGVDAADLRQNFFFLLVTPQVLLVRSFKWLSEVHPYYWQLPLALNVNWLRSC